MQRENQPFSGAHWAGIEMGGSPTYDSPGRQSVAIKHWYPAARQWVLQPVEDHLYTPCHENMKTYIPAS
jgi:hypothetical protein